MKKLLPWLGALVIVMAAVALIVFYKDNLEKKYLPDEKFVKVLVAKQAIPDLMMVTLEDVDFAEIPAKYQQPGAYTDGRELFSKDGQPLMMTLGPVLKGEQITPTKLSPPAEKYGRSLKIEKGKRAISFPVDFLSGVGGLLKPHNYVDVLATYKITWPERQGTEQALASKNITLTILQDIHILAVKNETGKEKIPKKREMGPDEFTPEKKEDEGLFGLTVTMELDPESVQFLTWSMTYASEIRLTLRPPNDHEIVYDIPPLRFGTLLSTKAGKPLEEKSIGSIKQIGDNSQQPASETTGTENVDSELLDILKE